MDNFRAQRNEDGSGLVWIETDCGRFEMHCADLDKDMDFVCEHILREIAVADGNDPHARFVL